MRDIISFYGLSRAGNHAVIFWIIKNIEKNTKKKIVFFNNAKWLFDTQDLTVAQAYGKLGTKEKRKQYRDVSKMLKDNKHQFALLSFEDRGICNVQGKKPFNEKEWHIKNHHKVVLIRDPFNYFASKIKHLHQKGKKNVALFKKNITPLSMRWIDYAKEYLGEIECFNKGICVSYNHWFLSASYRKKTFKKFGYGETDGAPYVKVHQFGHGSSFNGTSKKGTQLKVLDRWRVFQNDPLYRSVFKNKDKDTGKQLIHYSEKIFGKMPGTEVLY